MSFCVKNIVPRSDFMLGMLFVENLPTTLPREVLSKKLAELLDLRRTSELSPEEEKFRDATRKLLKNGKYRATGRGKPSSEYLLREACSESFPELHALVDLNNYLSLKYMVPISLWDLDLAKGKDIVFRLGKEGESYIFNVGGQDLKLEDLICGCVVRDGIEVPIITPVKDSLETKLVETSTNVGMAIYYPLAAGSRDHLKTIVEEARNLFMDMRASYIESSLVASTC
ncbi:MAG TPA: phenylalanine--tRNA ligase beta subunit-related protein [Planctomycetota bacterium]|nr:phenylalanine--tRNA ligase beta subunit-related protein [Planctomycetota bacterium]